MNIPPNCDTKQFDEAFSKYGPIFSSKLTATGFFKKNFLLLNNLNFPFLAHLQKIIIII